MQADVYVIDLFILAFVVFSYWVFILFSTNLQLYLEFVNSLT